MLKDDILQYMHEQSISLAECARRMRISRMTLANILKGKKSRFLFLNKVYDTLGKPYDDEYASLLQHIDHLAIEDLRQLSSPSRHIAKFVGRVFRGKRIERGWSNSDLSRYARISDRTIRRIEQWRVIPRDYILDDLFAALLFSPVEKEKMKMYIHLHKSLSEIEKKCPSTWATQ